MLVGLVRVAAACMRNGWWNFVAASRRVCRACWSCRDVIRVVKYWRDKEIKHWEVGVRPTSFVITLLVVHTQLQSKRHSSDKSAAIEAGVVAFLNAIVSWKSLWQNWVDHGWFSPHHIPDEVTLQRPLLLDPSDPTNNVAESVDKWEVLASICAETLEKFPSRLKPAIKQWVDLD